MSTYAIKMNGADGSTYLPVTSTSLIQHKYGSSTDKLTSYLGSYIETSAQTFKKTNALYPIPLSTVETNSSAKQMKDFYWNNKLRYNPSLSYLMIGQNSEQEPGSMLTPLPSYIKISGSTGIEMFYRQGSGTDTTDHYGTITPDYYTGTSAYADYVNNLDLPESAYFVTFRINNAGQIECEQTFDAIMAKWEEKIPIFGKIVNKTGANSNVWIDDTGWNTQWLSYFRHNTMLCSYYNYGSRKHFLFDCGIHTSKLGNSNNIPLNFTSRLCIDIDDLMQVPSLSINDFSLSSHTHTHGETGIMYLICNTAANTSPKICDLLHNGSTIDEYSGFTLKPGAIISVYFPNGNTLGNFNLNVLGTGSKGVIAGDPSETAHPAEINIGPDDTMLFQLTADDDWQILSSEQSIYKTAAVSNTTASSYAYITGKTTTYGEYQKSLLTYNPSIKFSGAGEVFSTYFNENGERLENKYAPLAYTLTNVFEVHFTRSTDNNIPSSDVITCDKTYAEMNAAWEAGMNIIGTITSSESSNYWSASSLSSFAKSILTCTKTSLNSFIFSQTWNYPIGGSEYSFAIEINSGNQITINEVDYNNKYARKSHTHDASNITVGATRYKNTADATLGDVFSYVAFQCYNGNHRTVRGQMTSAGHFTFNGDFNAMSPMCIYYACDHDNVAKLGNCNAINISYLIYSPDDQEDEHGALTGPTDTTNNIVPPQRKRAIFYCVIFVAGADDIPIIIPSQYKWKDNVAPTIRQGWQYELIFFNNIATIIGTNPAGA